MKLVLERKWKKADYTIGVLSIDDKRFCETLEDTDRGLTDNMSLNDIAKIKKPSITAIPTGTYNITLNVVSPKFSKKAFYQNVCKGRVPRLLNVKGFDGILIHVGDGANGAKLTDGCILVGRNKIKGGLTNGKETFTKLYEELKKGAAKGETLTITIK